MFAKGAPWKKLYVKAVSVEPVNMHGGPRGKDMQFGEEVVVHRLVPMGYIRSRQDS